MDILFLIGRALFSAVFIVGGIGHFRRREDFVSQARRLGVPCPAAAVAVSGCALLAGGSSVLLGFFGSIGALLLSGVLMVVTFLMHPPSVTAQRVDFLKNVALAGAAVMIFHFGTGPFSVLQMGGVQRRVRPPSTEGGTEMNLRQSKVISVSINASVARVYDFVLAAENMPKWMSSFVRSVTRDGDKWIADTSAGRMEFEFVPRNEFGVLDHWVTLPSGVTVLNPMRVVPNGAGCEISFTLFRLPEMTGETFSADAANVEHDLQTLKKILEAGTA
ncbi:MAG: DoxX family membrane protein [Acidobacteriota bacterium]